MRVLLHYYLLLPFTCNVTNIPRYCVRADIVRVLKKCIDIVVGAVNTNNARRTDITKTKTSSRGRSKHGVE